MNTTSESLLLRVRRSTDAEAWGRFVRIYSPLLYDWAYHHGLSEADAADLVQDVFTILVQKLPQFIYNPQRSFRNWLWTVMHNRVVQLRRRRKPITGLLNFDGFATDEDDSVAEAEFFEYLLARLVPIMKEQFQPTTWQAFWKFVVEGKTAPQVADELGMSAEAVYKAKVRVLVRLQAEFAGLLSD